MWGLALCVAAIVSSNTVVNAQRFSPQLVPGPFFWPGIQCAHKITFSALGPFSSSLAADIAACISWCSFALRWGCGCTVDFLHPSQVCSLHICSHRLEYMLFRILGFISGRHLRKKGNYFPNIMLSILLVWVVLCQSPSRSIMSLLISQWQLIKFNMHAD